MVIDAPNGINKNVRQIEKADNIRQKTFKKIQLYN